MNIKLRIDAIGLISLGLFLLILGIYCFIHYANDKAIKVEILESEPDKLVVEVEFGKTGPYPFYYMNGFGFESTVAIFDGRDYEITDLFSSSTHDFDESGEGFQAPASNKGYIYFTKSKNVWHLRVQFVEPGKYTVVLEDIEVCDEISKNKACVSFWSSGIEDKKQPRIYLHDKKLVYIKPKYMPVAVPAPISSEK